MTLSLVANDPNRNAAAPKRMSEARLTPEFSIVRYGGFVGMLCKELRDLPYLADQHGGQLEIFPADEVELILTGRELAEYWLSREKPTPTYPTTLRAYDKDCRWKCGANCAHRYQWTCPNCENTLVSANAEEFGRYFSRYGDCFDCRRAEADKETQSQPANGEVENAPSDIFDFYQATTGN